MYSIVIQQFHMLLRAHQRKCTLNPLYLFHIFTPPTSSLATICLFSIVKSLIILIFLFFPLPVGYLNIFWDSIFIYLYQVFVYFTLYRCLHGCLGITFYFDRISNLKVSWQTTALSLYWDHQYFTLLSYLLSHSLCGACGYVGG